MVLQAEWLQVCPAVNNSPDGEALIVFGAVEVGAMGGVRVQTDLNPS